MLLWTAARTETKLMDHMRKKIIDLGEKGEKPMDPYEKKKGS